MGRRKYPLEPLALIRKTEVDKARQGLVESVVAREKAEVDASEKDERAKAFARDVASTKEAEMERLEAGELRVSDLLQTNVWADGARQVQRSLDEQSHQATQRVQDALHRESGAREALAVADARLDVVDKSRVKHEMNEKRADDAREEEAMVEAHRPKGRS